MSFSESTLEFLRQLQRNNRKEWFDKNKPRYEEFVREPALKFITDVGSRLGKVSPHFLALARKTGGSLMRVYRDTRFSKDKTPYKTNIGIHFRHEFGKDVHTPGYYVHLSPDECFLGVGIWHPESEALKKIRTHIVDESELWTKVVRNKTFRSGFELSGDSLKKAPLGFDKDHPLIVDLRRKDFIGISPFTFEEAYQKDFPARVTRQFKKGNAFMRFLCDALRVPF